MNLEYTKHIEGSGYSTYIRLNVTCNGVLVLTKVIAVGPNDFIHDLYNGKVSYLAYLKHPNCGDNRPSRD